jgi:tetratricopeptide (TPR) repeat protein
MSNILLFRRFSVRKVISAVLLLCFFAALFVEAGCGPKDRKASGREILEQIPGFDPNAIVTLAYLGRSQRGVYREWPKTAFVIGDGTLILTAAHCVDSFQDPRRQAVSPDIVVISPYYGDIFDFEILGLDKEADLALLRASWPAHPAVIASRPCTPVEGKPPWRLSPQPDAERLPVLSLSDDEPNEAVVLKGTRKVAPGWSGSPFVLPKTGKVVGVLGKLKTGTRGKDGPIVKGAAGCDTGSIDGLLRKHGLQTQAHASVARLKPVEAANQVFDLAIDYVEALQNLDLTGAIAVAKELVGLRPQSVQARLFLAFSAHEKYTRQSSTEDLVALAESNFKQALILEPNNARAHAGYGNFLQEHKRYEEALTETEATLAIDPNNELALANRVNILTETDPSGAEQIARRLVEKDPDNSHWWFWYYRALAKLGQREKALEAAQKAVELNPDGVYYGGLADALRELHRYDDAEPHYKEMTERCGCQTCWYKYADFLVYHRPGKPEEAEKALDRAESKKTAHVAKKTLVFMRLQLLEKKSPDKAEALARQLLEQSPENADHWWCLAGILRAQDKHEEAVEAARRAVDLDPNGPYHPRLAACLAKSGQLDEAEQTYKQVLRDHPERAKYWYWYAGFLCDYFPDRLEEARQALEKAEDPQKDWSVSSDTLRELQEKIDSQSDVVDDAQDD